MILSDTLSHFEVMKNKAVSIMAVDETFVTRNKGETVYESAKISAEDIVKTIKDLK